MCINPKLEEACERTRRLLTGDNLWTDQLCEDSMWIQREFICDRELGVAVRIVMAQEGLL